LLYTISTYSVILAAEIPPFGSESLEPLIFSLGGFIPSELASSPLVQHAESRKALIVADIESLEECVTLLEGLSLDSEDIRMRFVESLSHPPEQSLILQLVDFIEKGEYPEYWNLDGDQEQQQREKAFDVCKAGSIKALVSIAGETKAMEKLWGDGDILVKRMEGWITTGATNGSKRDDLIIAGCLTLGNLARKGHFISSLSFSTNTARRCILRGAREGTRPVTACLGGAFETRSGHQGEARGSRTLKKPGPSICQPTAAWTVGSIRTIDSLSNMGRGLRYGRDGPGVSHRSGKTSVQRRWFV
jgi:hypothetical protein